ncbi:MAG: glycosyltransferase, partial [Acidobacteria bacterium]|nr:glycosyltransferase [Acidobacteriota bacterium]
MLLNIIKGLDRGKFAPAVCVLRKGGHLECDIEQQGIPLLEAPFAVSARPYRSLPFRAWDAARFFQPYGFDIWHSFHYIDDYTEPLIARLAGARAWIYTKKNMSWGGNGWRLRSLLASRIVADNSTMLSSFFRSRLLAPKTQLIGHGVDTREFDHRPPASGLRERLAIDRDALLVGCVAELLPVKGHPTLVRAMARVPGVHLLLAGRPLDREYSDSLRQLSEELGLMERVHFFGSVQDVPGFLAELDIFVLPTWAKWRMEGCPVALLEAMACGVACIATDIPGSRDVIENGLSGVLVPPEDEVALAQQILSLAASPARRRQLSEAARRRILAHYTIEREVAAYE